MASSLSVSVLGPVEVLVDGRPLVVDTRKAIALLATLAVRGEPLTRALLGDLFWSEADQAHAMSALRRTLSVLRAAVGDGWLDTPSGSIGLSGDNLEVDVVRERSHWARIAGHHHRDASQSGRCPGCLDELESVARLHRGPFMAGFSLRDGPEFEDWQAGQAREAERRLRTALERLSSGRAAQGRLDEALGHAERWLGLDPLNEAAYRELMRLYASAGDRASAIRRYRDCVRILDEQLAVAPLAETTAVYQSVTAHGRDAPAPSSVPAAPPTPRHLAVDAAFRAPLVGRASQLGALVGAWSASGQGGHLALVEGEVGVGKTRLVEELATIVQRASGTVLITTCHAADQARPYAPIADLLGRSATLLPERVAALPEPARRAAARLAPALERLPRMARTGDAGRHEGAQREGAGAFLQDVGTALLGVLEQPTAATAPSLLVIDDAQWIDTATVGVLLRLAPRLRAPGQLLLVARQRVEAGHDPLGRLVEALGRDGPTVRVAVGRLAPDEVAELVRLAGPPDVDVAALVAATDGVPLLVTESLAARRLAVSTGAIIAGPARADGMGPGDSGGFDRGTLAPVEDRVGELSEEAGQVLAAAAVMERAFDPDLIGEVSGRSEEETTRALEELVRAGLLVERAGVLPRGDGLMDGHDLAAEGYDFEHPRTRDLAYRRVGLARRRQLHRRAADSLARHSARAAAGVLATDVARHYQRAGDDRQAAIFLVQAGRRAEDVWANTEALGHYRAAIALDPRRAADLRERMADLEVLLGRYEAGVHELEAAIASTLPGDDTTLGRLERKLAAVHRRQGDFAMAETHVALALARLPEDSVSERLAAVLEQALLAQRQGETTVAADLVATGLDLAGRVPDRALAARAHNVAGMLARAAGDPERAVDHLRRSLDLASSAGSLEARAAALNNLALVERELGRLEPALEFTNASLRICVRLGDRHREAALRNNLADLFHAAGRDDSAMLQLRQAVTILADLGEPGQLQPEIWRLVEW